MTILIGIVGGFFEWLTHRMEVLLLFAGIGSWRWSWFSIQSARAILYRYAVYPALRRQARRATAEAGPVPDVIILAVTYREKPWITRAVFEAVFRELSTLRGLMRPAKVVVATGCDADDATVRAVYDDCCRRLQPAEPALWPPQLSLLRSDNGKRPAIASALREIVSHEPHPDGAVVFMDGDTIPGEGLFAKVLPLFRLKEKVSAVTTDENGWVQGPRWFSEWISLRLGLRHRTMCSTALSGRLLCLTGRFSVFRGEVATDPSFMQQIEKDSIHHWLWGSFDMLSGDDKSTWYWLAARERRMLYVPDAVVTTIEVVSGSAVQRALANIRRWSGNSLRHSWRALKLGPTRLNWFCWYSLLDQRLAIWTVLIGPLFALLALLSGHVQVAAGYFLWVIFSRLAHAAVSWQHGRRFSAYYLPLQLVSDWAISLTKIWVLFHPAKQTWMNRGARTLDTTVTSAFYRFRTAAAHYLYGFTCVATIAAIGVYTGFLPVLHDLPLYFDAAATTESSPAPSTTPADGGANPSALLFGMEAPKPALTAPVPPKARVVERTTGLEAVVTGPNPILSPARKASVLRSRFIHEYPFSPNDK